VLQSWFAALRTATQLLLLHKNSLKGHDKRMIRMVVLMVMLS